MNTDADGLIHVTHQCESDDPCFRAFCRNGTCVREPLDCVLVPVGRNDAKLALRGLSSSPWTIRLAVDLFLLTVVSFALGFVGIARILACFSTVTIRKDATKHELRLSDFEVGPVYETHPRALVSQIFGGTKARVEVYGAHENDVECSIHWPLVKMFALADAPVLVNSSPSGGLSIAFVSILPALQFHLAKTPAEITACYEEVYRVLGKPGNYVLKKMTEYAANEPKDEN